MACGSIEQTEPGAADEETEGSSDDGESGTDGDGTEAMDVAETPDPPATAIDVSVGARHTCAVLEGGTVRCFGRVGVEGLLGTATKAPSECQDAKTSACGAGPACCVSDDEALSEVPDVELGVDAVRVVASADSTCVLSTEGEVKCWGRGDSGRLGLGHVEAIGDDESPADVEAIDLGGVAVELGLSRGFLGGAHFVSYLHNRHACALLEDGTLRCWGEGSMGALGYGNIEHVGDDEVPAEVGPVPVGGTVHQVAVGGGFTCALMDAGMVRCWGFNGDGELGQGLVPTGKCFAWGPVECGEGCCLGHEQPASELPFVPLPQPALELVAGGRFACARIDETTLHCWGEDWTEEGESAAQAAVVDFGGPIESMHAGLAEVCAVVTGGILRCASPDPDNGVVVVEGIELGAPVAAVSALGEHCALLTDGTLRCWGFNRDAQLGVPIPPVCFENPENPGVPDFDCERDPGCCLGDDESLDSLPPVPL